MLRVCEKRSAVAAWHHQDGSPDRLWWRLSHQDRGRDNRRHRRQWRSLDRRYASSSSRFRRALKKIQLCYCIKALSIRNLVELYSFWIFCCFRSWILPIYSSPQSSICTIIGPKLVPNSVREYSTLGGTSL